MLCLVPVRRRRQRGSFALPAPLTRPRPPRSCRAATMGKQATFNMIAGAAIVIAPMAHMMSRYYCTTRPFFSPSRSQPSSCCATAARWRKLHRWQRRRTQSPCAGVCIGRRAAAGSSPSDPLSCPSQHVERRQAHVLPQRIFRQVPGLVGGLACPELRHVPVLLRCTAASAEHIRGGH